MTHLTEWITSSEEWIQNQISHYVGESITGHDSFFDPNDWVPIPEVSRALITAIENPGQPRRELPSDGDFFESGGREPVGDPVIPLVKTYTRRNLEQGTPPARFLSMLKCYRRSYLKLIHNAGFEKSFAGYCHRRVADFFDRFEILSSIIWTKVGAGNSENIPAPAPSEASLTAVAEPLTAQVLKTRMIDQLIEGITYEINPALQSVTDKIMVLEKDFAVISKILESYHSFLIAVKAGEATMDTVLELEQEVRGAELESLTDALPGVFRQLGEGAERATKIVGAMKEVWRTRIDEDINININQVLENILIITRNHWKFVAEVKLELDPGLPVVLGSPGDFNQVILNLMIHSIHSIAAFINNGAMAKGIIQITTGIAGNWIEIRIQNNGKRIWNVETKPEALNPSDVVDENEREIMKRWMVCQEVMKNFGGNLEMEADGRETVMVIRLPIETAV